MKFNIPTHGMVFEIDLSNLVYTINSGKNGKNFQTSIGARIYADELNKRIVSSNVRIKMKKYINSITSKNIENSRLVERRDGIYLVFSVVNEGKKYCYDFHLMKKMSYELVRNYIIFSSYEMREDEECLRVEDMTRVLTNGVKNCVIKNIGISFKLVGFLIIIAGLFTFGITNAFAFFG